MPVPLPLASAPPAWEGYTPATAAPEPILPQGEYGPTTFIPLPRLKSDRPVELLAPAGGPDAAFAAFHYGADAIYLGLQKFSARAEAENFTFEQLAEVTALAHALSPRRRVFVALNTVIRQDELAELAEVLGVLAAIGVDAVIVQDLGVARAVRRWFPELELHASTQLAVHNRAGAAALRQLGFARVVLARELTFEEIDDITAAAGVETEVFVHGALCYSYSGLCLFSSQTLGRSGNRGRCAYSCRDSYTVADAPTELRDGSPVRRDPRHGFPFSMKDLALPDFLPALRSAGVGCFKIEGRKKSPLYVATTTHYYRRLLDGTLTGPEREITEEDLRTVFSRPWTRLFVGSHRDKEVADRDTVGHRGAEIGRVEAVFPRRLAFQTRRRLEKHDGLQVDLPVLGKPFGFAVDRMWVVDRGRTAEAFVAPANSAVEVELPEGHPAIPVGAPVYCSSSQQVKQRYRYDRPKAGAHRPRWPVDVSVSITAAEVTATARYRDVTVTHALPGPFAPAHDSPAASNAVAGALARLGDTALFLNRCDVVNAGFFVPVSRLNALRRELAPKMQAAVENYWHDRTRVARADVVGAAALPSRAAGFRWSIKVDRVEALDALTPADRDDVEEFVIDIARDHPTILFEKLAELDRDRVRLALPALTRKWEEHALTAKIAKLRAAGYRRWEASNISAWSFLDPIADLDLAADWPLYVLNRQAAEQLRELGVRRFTLSPEDGRVNMRSLLAEFADSAVVVVHQDTPQFIAESCAYANLIGGCPGKANCRFESMEMVSSHGERVRAVDYHCRTIVLNDGAYCLAPRLAELRAIGAVHLRADFVFRRYTAEQVRDVWRTVRAGRGVPGGHAANFERGVL